MFEMVSNTPPVIHWGMAEGCKLLSENIATNI